MSEDPSVIGRAVRTALSRFQRALSGIRIAVIRAELQPEVVSVLPARLKQAPTRQAVCLAELSGTAAS
jgi:hypothetical protein